MDNNAQTKVIEKKVYNNATKIAAIEEELFYTLYNCNCCSRHRLNKPNNLLGGWKETRRTFTHRDKTNDCKCICRHTIRWMARKYDNINPWYLRFKTVSSEIKNSETQTEEQTEEQAEERKAHKHPRSYSPEWRPGWHNY